MLGRPISIALVALTLPACSDPLAAPDAASPLAARAAGSAGSAGGAVMFWNANATAHWNARATALAVGRGLNVSRMYAYLSLAQLRAAEDALAIRPHPPTASAIGAASASVLAAFVPAEATALEAELDAQGAAEPWPGAKHEDFAVGEAIGRAAAARVLAWSAGDRMGQSDPGVPPTTPGHWLWSGGPIVRGSLGARPFYLASQDELRPPQPPAFGSAAFLAALAEVRAISDTRTAEQIALAQYWAVNQSPASGAAFNDLAVELIRSHRRGDAESARILFLVNSATFDGAIGCFDAKYHYWFIRPTQANPLITLAVPLPAHPSYPSGHSCISGAWSGVLMAEFPDERDRIDALAHEASLSRLYGGLHYRFDLEAGIAVGRGAAARALAANLDAVAIR